jgi:hypothetical protein
VERENATSTMCMHITSMQNVENSLYVYLTSSGRALLGNTAAIHVLPVCRGTKFENKAHNLLSTIEQFLNVQVGIKAKQRELYAITCTTQSRHNRRLEISNLRKREDAVVRKLKVRA